MNGSDRSVHFVFIIAFCIVALVLTVAWPVATATAFETPGEDGAIPIKPADDGLPAAPPTQVPTPTYTPTPTATPGGEGNGDLPGNPELATPTPSSGGNGSTPPSPVDDSLSEHERINALARNRIIFHAATPIQLCRVEEGLQVYYIGRKGDTRLGPWVPPFSELVELYPDGEEVSLFRGYNPLTGKRVKIDYLPSVNRIRVDTFYADRDTDRNKQYIFHFGPEHDITYDVW